MGVNLSDLIPGREVELEFLCGKRIAIDAYNTLYQFLSIIRDRFTGEPLRDSEGNITSHLSGLFYRTAKLLENSIDPVFVFDGKPPEFKKDIINQREAIREEARKKWEDALKEGDIEKIRTYAQGALKLTEDMVEESKRLLDYMGVPWVQAPSEGEAQAAFMVRKNLAWAAGSQDWDSLLFGSPRFVKNLTITGRRKVPRKEKYINVKPEIIELDDVLSKLDITHDQLIILGILIGTDYNPGGVKGIGPKTALKLVKEKQTLDNIMKDLKWEFDITPEDIFNFFKNPPVSDVEIKKNPLQEDKLIELLVEKHGFSRERIENVINKLKELESSGKQTGLASFFKQ